ncbi:MAG: Rpn family recombination-promoting nuclease/putative transposase [Clostridiales bacterium]|nr:Rpn family recombination-promoting nuclease/putative transposase [Clostridiales bacterium]
MKIQEESELLNPKIDYVFKRIFGYQGNETITKSFISAVLNQNITEVVLENNLTLPKDMLDDKVGILDVKAKIDNKINCDIEMQVIDEKNVEKRILFYSSKMYIQTITEGKDYSELQKCIAILITDYEISGLRDIEKYMTKWNIREEDYGNVILTDVIEIYIIELPKVEKYKNGKPLDLWVEFIKNPKVIDMSNGEIKKAKEILEKISQDKNERYLAELREKYIMDQKAIEGAGYDKGLNDGVKQGRKQGEEKKTIELAKKMKQQGIDIEVIKKITGLSLDKINEL